MVNGLSNLASSLRPLKLTNSLAERGQLFLWLKADGLRLMANSFLLYPGMDSNNIPHRGRPTSLPCAPGGRQNLDTNTI